MTYLAYERLLATEDSKEAQRPLPKNASPSGKAGNCLKRKQAEREKPCGIENGGG